MTADTAIILVFGTKLQVKAQLPETAFAFEFVTTAILKHLVFTYATNTKLCRLLKSLCYPLGGSSYLH